MIETIFKINIRIYKLLSKLICSIKPDVHFELYQFQQKGYFRQNKIEKLYG